VIRDAAVVLLGHGPVMTAQTRLEVTDGDAELHRRQRAGEGGIDVARHHDEIRSQLDERLLEAHQRARRLLRVCARPHGKSDVRARQRQLCEEHVVQEVVVMLAGVDETLLHLREPRELGVERCNLHVVRARSDDVGD
jgi:hypothetical protein